MSVREKRIAAATAAFVAAAVLYVLVVDPVLRAWQGLNDEISSKTVILKKEIGMIALRKAIEEKYSKLSKYVRSEQSSEDASAQMLIFLENLARSDSCLVLNIKPVGTKVRTSYKEILADLSCSGSAAAMTKFLYDIENAKDMILKVRHFVLSSKAGQDGSLRGTFLIGKIVVE